MTERSVDKKTEVRSTEEALSTFRALKLALEALEYFYLYAEGRNEEKMADKAITAIREALAEQPAQQEPVALFTWLPEGATHIGRMSVRTCSGGSLAMSTHAFKYENGVLRVYVTDNDNEYPGWRDAKDVFFHLNFPVLPLYTSPPASKPWVGLTEEDIEAAMPGGIYDCLADPWDCGVGDGDYMRSIKNDVVRIVRAIEAKLKEKNT